MTDLTSFQRQVAAALIDRLITESETHFRIADAAELFNLIPAPSLGRRLRSSLPSVQGKVTIPRSGFSGAGAGGVGSINLDGDETTVEFDTSGRQVFRAGQWKITRSEGLFEPLFGKAEITITQVMSTLLEPTSAFIEFSDGEPIQMLRFSESTISFGGVGMTSLVPVPWKFPVMEFHSRAAA